jgi:hypothetical protein
MKDEVTFQTEPTKPVVELRRAKYVGSLHHLRGYDAQVLVNSNSTTVRAKIFGPLARTLAHGWEQYPETDFEIGGLVAEAELRNPCTEYGP